jgi:hypothetical protein
VDAKPRVCGHKTLCCLPIANVIRKQNHVAHGISMGPQHTIYFNPAFPEFAPRTMWSLGNAFTSMFKELDPIPQFKATAKLGSFFEAVSPAT